MSLTEEDSKFVDLCIELKEKLPTKPILSGFRVFAILTYTTPSGELRYITGTNAEPCFMGSAICAERSALVQLRQIPHTGLVKIYLTTDAPVAVTPGLLCREFLLEYATLDTPIVLTWIPTDKSKTHTGKPWAYRIATLRTLYPHPPLLLHVQGSQSIETAKALAKKAQPVKGNVSESGWDALYEAAVKATVKDNKDYLFPMRFAGGVMFSNGETKVAAMTKLAEYGFTLEPTVKLIPIMEEYQAKGIKPVVLMIVDQFGNLWAPFAPGRAHLFEGGHDCTILVHTPEGKLARTTPTELSPDIPRVWEGINLGGESKSENTGADKSTEKSAAASKEQEKDKDGHEHSHSHSHSHGHGHSHSHGSGGHSHSHGH